MRTTTLLDDYEERLHAVTRDLRVAEWAVHARVAAMNAELGRRRAWLLGDPAVDRWLTRSDDPRARRLRAERERVRLEPSGAMELAAERRRLDAATGDALDVLRGEPDRGRRERAWRARVAVGDAIAPRLIDLVRRRVAATPAYWERTLALLGLDDARVLAELAALDAATAPAWRVERETRGATGLAPWDLYLEPPRPGTGYASWTPPGDLASSLAAAVAPLGFDLAALPIRIDEAAGAHPMTFAIDAPHDVRVVLPPDAGRAGWRAAFHELGHALYAAHHDPDLPWSLRDAPAPWVHEAVAERFASLVADPGRLVEARFRIVLVHLERHMYTHVGADPTRRYCELVEEHVGVATDGAAWARVVHFLTHPGHLASYVVADRVAPRLVWNDLPALFRAGALAPLPS